VSRRRKGRGIDLGGFAHGLFESNMSRSLSQITDDRNEKAQALKTIYDGLRMALDGAYQYQLACLRHDQATDQATAVSSPIAAEITPAQDYEPWMTADELGDYLKLEPQTLRDWARKGRIPSQPVNGERRFRLSEINQWLESQRDKIEKSSPTQNNTVVKSDRSILRPQNQGAKSNGRV